MREACSGPAGDAAEPCAVPTAPTAAEVALGEALHREVGPERWCVTYWDLLQFRREVVLAVRKGAIAPTTVDAFDPEDEGCGPNVFTVNERLIKPRTLEAGGMSWALMRHPQGLDCGLFVSHCWQEGVVEFLDKVRASWRSLFFSSGMCRLGGAWCCMFANPQNLNISRLIKDPRSSPFSVALRHSRVVLVVPNHRVSVYTRLWCVFEAFTAQECGKVVQTAVHVGVGPTACALAPLVALALASFACSYLFVPRHHAPPHAALLAPYVLLVVGSCLLEHPCARMLCANGSALFAGFLLGLPAAREWGPEEALLIFRDCAPLHLLVPLAAEVDRVVACAERHEACRLSGGFSSVVDARCTSPADERRIRANIGEKGPDIDEAIDLLVRAGMSTPSLQAAARAGIRVDLFGSARIANTVLLAAMVATSLRIAAPQRAIGWNLLGLVPMVWLGCSGPEHARLLSLAQARCFWLLVAPAGLVMLFVWLARACTGKTAAVVTLLMAAAAHLLASALALAGLVRLLQVPCIGRIVVQTLVARSRNDALAAICGKHMSDGNDGSTTWDSSREVELVRLVHTELDDN